MNRWHRFLGVRPRETGTVWLFFAHNFLLGTGTILVYVVANVLLLARHPERNLPLAYCVGALATMAAGRLYAHYEHHWLLRKLAVRALLVAAVLTLVLGLLLRLGPSVATAVAVMTGYRLIYLLTNLEFWGLSAVVFNVRQGRRLFSIISAGDLPAKALGAVLTVFVHARYELYGLLLTAFGAYLLALLMQRATFQSQEVAARPGPPRGPRPPAPPLVRQVFGGSPLVRALGPSLTALAAVAVGVEYFFFVNVKDKLQDQTTILQYVGGVLALTYLLAMLAKVLFSRHGLDRLGVRWSLAVLPLAALAGLGLFGALRAAHAGPAAQMAYFCGLYLGLEVLRRALFEPVFLVLFQPLTPPERLEGHTLAKGFYEPLGLGIGGLLLLALHGAPALNQWVPFGWMGLFLLGALALLQRTYWQYLDELKGALGLRFTESPPPARPPDAPPATAVAAPGPNAEKALQAIEHLQKTGPTALAEHAEALLKHSDSRVRSRVLGLLGPRADAALLRRLALADPDPALRELASRWASPHPGADDLLQEADLAVRQGAIRGRLEAVPADAQALASLAAVVAAADTSSRLAALALLGFLPLEQQVAAVTAGLHSPEPALVQAAVQAAAETPSRPLMELLIALLRVKAVQQPAATALARLGAAALPLLKEALMQATDGRHLQSLAQVCARLATPAARQLLVEVAQADYLPGRAAALRALGSFATMPADTPLFQRLVEEEIRVCPAPAARDGHGQRRAADGPALRAAQGPAAPVRAADAGVRAAAHARRPARRGAHGRRAAGQRPGNAGQFDSPAAVPGAASHAGRGPAER